MKAAIISDIHGNMEAFTQVLADIDKSQSHSIISLGDNIGYGPESELIMKRIRELKIASIMGNHEMALKESHCLNSFNPIARKSLLKDSSSLSKETIMYIKGLKKSLVRLNCLFVHGYPPDSTFTYLFEVTENQLIQTLKNMKEKICFLGHTHRLELVEFDGKGIHRRVLNEGITQLKRTSKYIVNIGSVGQPRDGDKSAKYVIYDSTHCNIDVRYVTCGTL